MKITFVLPGVSEGGGTRVVGSYAGKLLEMGHDVTVISREPRKPTKVDRLRRLLGGGPIWPDAKTRTRFLDFLGKRHVQVPHGGPLLSEDVPDADIIVATWWRTAFEVAILPPAKGKKIYFVQGHEVFPHLPYDLSAGSYHLPLKKLAVSQWLVDTMSDLYGDDNVALVPNGVDTAAFHSSPREKNAQPTVGFVFSRGAFKGAQTALAAIRKVRTQIPGLRVVSFGTEVPEGDLRLPQGAEFHKSPTPELLRQCYASCDVWLSASRSEGFGLPLLEAMACRCPIVATRTGAAPDLIDPGVNGYIADVDDVDELAKGLVRILSLSASDWRRMSDAAEATARRHSVDESAKIFEAALRDASRSA